jgi:FkbM family methyltransferase
MAGLLTLLEPGKEVLAQGLDERFESAYRRLQDGDPPLIFGAARLGRSFLHHLTRIGVRPLAFCDSDPGNWGMTIEGLPVLSPEQLLGEHRDALVLVASLTFESEICDFLAANGVKSVLPLVYLNYKRPEVFVSSEYEGSFDYLFLDPTRKQLEELWTLLADDESRRVLEKLVTFRISFDKRLIRQARSSAPQYFEPGVVRLTKEEVFVDCGGYIGDTLEEFLREVNGCFTRAYVFEPDSENFRRLRARTAGLDPARVVLVASGVYDRTGEVGFAASGSTDARVTLGQRCQIPIVALDEFFVGREVPTFIKMDIEGAERQAIAGARRTISEHKPRLALSAYHYANDLWEIPMLVKSLNPDYRLYLRHYTNEILDTVCYAC